MTATSPNLPVDTGIVHSAKEFSDGLTQQLTDDEIKRSLELIVPIKEKWEQRFRAKFGHVGFGIEQAMELVDQFEDELKTELRERLNVYCTVDVTPVFEGEPLVIEFAGVMSDHPSNVHGFDHEQKEWEVKHATARDEDYYGQKGKHKKK